VQAKRSLALQKLGELGPSVLAMLERDPSKRMTISAARTLWADILRRELAR
jgi:hypothetical protein